MRKILLVEDDPRIMEMNNIVLTMNEYQVMQANTLAQAERLLAQAQPNLIVLDIMMPDGSGLDFCVKIRAHYDTPILFLTALGDNSDVLRGLRIGADDYLAKPYDMDIFLARVEALLRRASRGRNAFSGMWAIGPLALDTTAGRAFINGEDMLLTPKDFLLLNLLAQHEGQLLEKAWLYERVWHAPLTQDDSALKSAMYRLRRRLGRDMIEIVSVRNIGYRLVWNGNQ